MFSTTVFHALERYLKEVTPNKRGWKAEQYRIAVIQRHPIAQKKLSAITPIDIASYRDDRLNTVSNRTGRKISPGTVCAEMSVLSDLWKIGSIEWGMADSTAQPNPVLQVRKPKCPSGRTRRLSSGEEKVIRRSLRNRPFMLAMFDLALETAMRQGEILSMQWEHINLKFRTVHLPHTKNGHSRDVPLSPRAAEILQALGPKVSGKVIPYTPEGFKTSWRILLQKNYINDLRFHDLRHEAISRLFERGGLDIMEVSSVSGHRTLSCLKRYTHLKARKIARKLDSTIKKQQKNLSQLLEAVSPYPAIVQESSNETIIEIPAFQKIKVISHSFDNAVQLASDALLREIIKTIMENEPLPAQDLIFSEHFYSEDFKPRIIMIEPI